MRLSTVAGLTSPEIARILGIPEGTVRTRLMRACRILRLSLAAAMGLVLAAVGGFLLRKRETEERVAAVLAASEGGAPTGPAAGATHPTPKIPSKGEETVAGAAQAPVARAAAAKLPSKKIFFPSPAPLSEQERLLVEYATSTIPSETAALSGFLDEPAPLPPLDGDRPSS